jgi:hypothetical protein
LYQNPRELLPKLREEEEEEKKKKKKRKCSILERSL